jgi:uncharacterized Zn finger protein (UPF0148 family)
LRCNAKHQKRDDASARLGEKLLQGWTMLASHCPSDDCFTPLMRNREGKMFCVGCNQFVITEEEAKQQQEEREQLIAARFAQEQLERQQAEREREMQLQYQRQQQQSVAQPQRAPALNGPGIFCAAPKHGVMASTGSPNLCMLI